MIIYYLYFTAPCLWREKKKKKTGTESTLKRFLFKLKFPFSKDQSRNCEQLSIVEVAEHSPSSTDINTMIKVGVCCAVGASTQAHN